MTQVQQAVHVWVREIPEKLALWCLLPCRVQQVQQQQQQPVGVGCWWGLGGVFASQQQAAF